MGQARSWTKEEFDYLESNWGDKSIPAIAMKLGRSINAIKIKAQRMGLGAVLMGGDYVTFHQLAAAVTGSSASDSYKVKSWIKNRGLPVHKRKVINNSFKVVYLDEFWKWAKKNRAFLDFSKMEPLALGIEPEWVAQQRKKDFESHSLQNKTPWTAYDDAKLKHLLNQQKYTFTEISDILHRSEGAIQRRCNDLNIKIRPIKRDNHGKNALWTDEMYNAVAEGIKNGDSYMAIARRIGKSEKAVRGKVYTVYLTENADKVRSMLNNGNWGDNAPEPTVRQALYLSRTRKECTAGLSALVGLLRYRMNSLGYEPYWQRHMCMNWDDYGGCLAKCDNCDDCTEFRRIKPQYCARCGGTFYERVNNRFCKVCRTARKKNAQKRWAMANKI